MRIVLAFLLSTLAKIKAAALSTCRPLIVSRPREAQADAFEQAMNAAPATSHEEEEALQALQMLGFQKGASEKALKAIRKELPNGSVEELIRAALKRL